MEQLQKLCTFYGISGDEGRVRDYIRVHAERYASEVRVDAMGNLLVLKKGMHPGAARLVCAHMDEVGLMVTSITKEGFLRCCTVGGVDARVLPGKPVRVLTRAGELPGVIGAKAVHLTEKEERQNAILLNDLTVDIGAADEAEADGLVQVGDYVGFVGPFAPFGDGLIRARALDDRAGCSILLSLLRQELPYDTWFGFTVQEEVGTRGAQVLCDALSPAWALVLETTTCADLPGVGEGERVTRLRGGAALSLMDKNAIYDRALIARAKELAEQNHIPMQLKQSTAGGNDAGALQRSNRGIAVCALSVPCRYLHAPHTVIARSDYDAVQALALALLQQN